MKLSTLFAAGLLGLSALTNYSGPVSAQNLTVMRGATSSQIKVSLNSAIVMESDESFAELSVANPGVADVAALSDRTIYVLGKTPGRTTLTLLGADGRLLTNVEVVVTPDLAEFKERLKEILPREKIEVRSANDGIVLSGIVSGNTTLARAIELAERYAPGRVTNLMSVGGSQQVMLKVRFAEMNRNVAKNLTSSIGVTGNIGGNGVVGGTGQVAQGTNLQNLVAGNAITSSTSRQGAFSYGFTAGGLAINVLLEALESKGMARTLAEPNLVAISGAEATFLAGGEFPIPVADDGDIGIDYRPFGIQLTFTPTVLNNEVINLRIETEASEPDPTNTLTVSGFSIPAFEVRRASTVVEMQDGQSIAIAGLLRDDFVDVANQVPWLGDVPILGALFRSANYTRNQSELVIIVTPHLVTPVDGNSLVLPTDRIRLPSESELFVLGRTSGNKTLKGRSAISEAATVSSQDFNGSYGYVLSKPMTLRILLGTTACIVGLTACSPETYQDPIGRSSAGSEVLSQNFGVATAANIQLQNIKAQRDLVMNLTRIFAAQVPATINFDFNKATLDEQAQAQLRQQAEWMKAHPNITFRVYGHTDLVGSNAYNKRLGQRRANAAVKFLVAQGVPREKVDGVVSFGETQPLVLTEARSRENRRTVTEVKGFFRPNNQPIDGKYALGVYNRYVTQYVRVRGAQHPSYLPPQNSLGIGVTNEQQAGRNAIAEPAQ